MMEGTEVPQPPLRYAGQRLGVIPPRPFMLRAVRARSPDRLVTHHRNALGRRAGCRRRMITQLWGEISLAISRPLPIGQKPPGPCGVPSPVGAS
jgi:hypothetical protein